MIEFQHDLVHVQLSSCVNISPFGTAQLHSDFLYTALASAGMAHEKRAFRVFTDERLFGASSDSLARNWATILNLRVKIHFLSKIVPNSLSVVFPHHLFFHEDF